MKILSFESTCDETAVAVVEDGRKLLTDQIFSQADLHAVYGGVVPEIASRCHIEAISILSERAIKAAEIEKKDIDAVAVSYAPGLIGAVLVGVNFAKSCALALDKPLIPVHHLRSHIAANYITNEDLKPPFLCLTVSGGNTLLTKVEDYTVFKPIGKTMDDAAGECLDKAARCMGLCYPGGVNIDKTATAADTKKYPLPYPKTENKFDFSFSGLKTAIVNITHNAAQKNEEIDVPVLAATVRQKVCDILIDKTMSAVREENAKTVVMAGGVSANSELRRRMLEKCKEEGIKLCFPELKYCGDNAAMVGVQAFYEYKSGNIAQLDLNAAATLPIDYI